MKCSECCFCWQAEGEKYPQCHYISPFPAPCEEEEEYDEEEDWE